MSIMSRLKLLLIESDQEVLQEHMNKLTDNKHDVSATTRAKSGVLMISNGHIYDCIVIDAEKCNDMDLMIFLHQIFKHRPKQYIIVMGSKETRQRIAKEADQRYTTILFILKPCHTFNEICRGLQYVVSQRMGFEEGTSNGKLHERSLAHNIFHRTTDILIKPSTIINTPMINHHNIPSSNVTYGGLNLNSHKYGVMCKPQTYVNISSDVGESSMKRNICNDLANDKGNLLIFDLKRKYYQPVEDIIRPRTAWTRELASDFKTLSAALKAEKAYPGTIPSMQVNALGLERNHIASHQQMYHERNNYMKNLSVVGPFQRCNNSLIESYGSRSFRRSTTSANAASSIIQSSNASGISLMSVDNLHTNLDDFSQSSLPHQTTTTTINNYGVDLSQPLIGETSISNALGLFENRENCNGDQGSPEVQNTVVGYETGMEPLVTNENFSQHSFRNAVAPSSDAESQFKFFSGFDELSQVITGARPVSSDLGLAENLENGTGDQGIHEVQNTVVTACETSLQNTFGNAMAPPGVVALAESEFQFPNDLDELSQVLRGGLVENANSGHDPVSEVQTEAVNDGIGITPFVTTNENFSQHVTVGEAMATMVSEFNFSDLFGTTNYGGTCDNNINEVLAPVDCYGIAIDPWVNHDDNAETTSNDFNNLNCPIEENLFDTETPMELNFSDLDAISVGDASASATFSVALNGSADGDMENDWFQGMINHDREISMEGIDGSCGHLINGTFGSEDSPWSI